MTAPSSFVLPTPVLSEVPSLAWPTIPFHSPPPPHPHQKIFFRQKKKFMKGARKWRSNLGTQTVLASAPPPPPVYVTVATKPWPAGCWLLPVAGTIACPALTALRFARGQLLFARCLQQLPPVFGGIFRGTKGCTPPPTSSTATCSWSPSCPVCRVPCGATSTSPQLRRAVGEERPERSTRIRSERGRKTDHNDEHGAGEGGPLAIHTVPRTQWNVLLYRCNAIENDCGLPATDRGTPSSGLARAPGPSLLKSRMPAPHASDCAVHGVWAKDCKVGARNAERGCHNG